MWKQYKTKPVFALLVIITTDNIYISHINCGVIQGFPALRKAVTTQVKKYRIFSRALIYPISLPHLVLIHPSHLSSVFSKGPVFSPPRVFFFVFPLTDLHLITSYTLIKMSVWFVVNNTNFILLARIIFSVGTLNIKRKKISMQRHQKDDGSLFRLRRLQRDFWPREI